MKRSAVGIVFFESAIASVGLCPIASIETASRLERTWATTKGALHETLRQFVIGAIAFLGVLTLLILIAEAAFHRVGSQNLAAVTARLDAEEPGWRLPEIEAARAAARPLDERNPSRIVLQLHEEIPARWIKLLTGDEYQSDFPTNRTPTLTSGRVGKCGIPSSAAWPVSPKTGHERINR